MYQPTLSIPSLISVLAPARLDMHTMSPLSPSTGSPRAGSGTVMASLSPLTSVTGTSFSLTEGCPQGTGTLSPPRTVLLPLSHPTLDPLSPLSPLVATVATLMWHSRPFSPSASIGQQTVHSSLPQTHTSPAGTMALTMIPVARSTTPHARHSSPTPLLPLSLAIAHSRPVSPAPSLPLSPQTVQLCCEVKRLSANPLTPEVFGSLKQLSKSDCSVGEDSRDISMQLVLLQEAVMQCRLLASSQSDHCADSGSHRFMSHASSERLQTSTRIPSISPLPSVMHNNPVSMSSSQIDVNDTMLPYATAADMSRVDNPQSMGNATSYVNNYSAVNMPLHEDARHVLCVFFRAAEDVIPIDLSDTTFLPTPPEVSQQNYSPAESLSSPPPAYQRDIPGSARGNSTSSQPLSAQAAPFVPSSMIPSRVPALDVS
jgi:hypothetical protein